MFRNESNGEMYQEISTTCQWDSFWSVQKLDECVREFQHFEQNPRDFLLLSKVPLYAAIRCPVVPTAPEWTGLTFEEVTQNEDVTEAMFSGTIYSQPHFTITHISTTHSLL